MPVRPRRAGFSRFHAVERARERLETESYPRLQMSLIVGLTGAIGLLASTLMLRAGLDAMAWRYPLAVAVAYAGFLGLLWLWLRTRASDYLDAVNIDVDLPPFGGGPRGLRSGAGGDFGGGGSTASFDGPPLVADTPSPLSAAKDVAGAAGDADEFALPLLAIVMAIGLALASLYVVYLAPVLFAELLVDGTLSYVLYRHLRRHDTRHWLETACRRTSVPFLLTAVFLAIVGAAMTAYAPGARSIGEVVHHERAAR